ncbi:MAG: hypothetical protein PHE55_11745 [Methylococcaceae bacterium]|nr:hypothetical protein [Methylococcaceae bacterium]
MHFKRRLYWLLILLAWIANGQARAEEGSTEAWHYRLGQGLRLGDSGLWLGGYASARVEDYRQSPWRIQLSDVSLFVGWNKGAWRFFSEFEVGDGLQISNGRALTTGAGYFDLERLYLDHAFDDRLKIRGGKFLTPIGRWNLIHADPLVWTTSSPMVVEGPFAVHTTGGMLHGSFNAWDKQWNYVLYGGGRNELDFKPASESKDANFENIRGVRLFHEAPGRFLAGISYAHYEEKIYRPGDKNLLGLDAFWTRKHYELGGEFIYRFGSRSTYRNPSARGIDQALDDAGANPDQWGLYVQGVAPLYDHWFAIARYEAFQREGKSSPAHHWLGGLAYRPLPPLVFKLEYSFGSDNAALAPSKVQGGIAEGFAASIAVLF